MTVNRCASLECTLSQVVGLAFTDFARPLADFLADVAELRGGKL